MNNTHTRSTDNKAVCDVYSDSNVTHQFDVSSLNDRRKCMVLERFAIFDKMSKTAGQRSMRCSLQLPGNGRNGRFSALESLPLLCELSLPVQHGYIPKALRCTWVLYDTCCSKETSRSVTSAKETMPDMPRTKASLSTLRRVASTDCRILRESVAKLIGHYTRAEVQRAPGLSKKRSAHAVNWRRRRSGLVGCS